MSRLTFLMFVWSFIVLFFGFGYGCSKGERGLDFKDTLQVQLSAEPVSLDPALAEDGVSLKILNNIMDGLVGYNGEGHLVNRLAESVQISSSGTRYEFILKPKAVWSDGKPVRAADFVYGFRRSLSSQTASKLAAMLFSIRNARSYHANKVKAEELGVSATAENKLVIELERPTPYFLQSLTLSIAMPARQDFLVAHGGRWSEEAPVTGPFRIVSRKLDQYIRLEPNQQYWGAKKATKNVLIRIIHDDSTAVGLFEQGKLDILTKVPSLDLERLRNKKQIRVDPFLATYYLAFNIRKSPFQDRHFRRAVAGSIRRSEIIAVMGTGETPAKGWVPVGLEGYIPYRDPAPVFAESVAEVRARIARDKKPLSVSITSDTSSRNTMILEKVQQDLLSGLGLKVSITQMDWKTYVNSITLDASPIYRFGWLAPFMDPITHLEVFTSGNPNNYTGWSNAEYDRLVQEVARLAPGRERVEKIRKAQELLVDQEAVVIPVYHYVQVHGVAKRVVGFRVNPFGVIRYEELDFKN